MLRKFKIAIDGQDYLVEMEEIGGTPATPAPAPVPATTAVAEPVAQAPVEAPAPAAAPAPQAPAGADALTAPMPGSILRILVNAGDAVKQNQPVMILEAMKMENEIVATKDGVVASLHVSQGDMVNPGDALITIN